jgi:phosphopantetheinyl transferase
LETNVRNKREWLLGRACIKEAVRYWIFKETGTLLYPSDIVVLHDELGAPHVDGWWNGDVIEAPEVSLSHDSRLSLAAVTAPYRPVGVDIEHIGRFKSTDLIEGSLAARERALLKGLVGHDLSEKVLRMWCAKEAAAKYLGIGLKGNPEEFEVSFKDDEWRLAHVAHDEFLVEVAIDCEDNSIIALASAPSE